MRFNLKSSFPLLTTKRVFWKGVLEELLWFIRGETDSNTLSKKGVKIWDSNGSLEFLEGRGLGHRERGDLGPVYGFQWRHFGATYKDMNTDYTGEGVDQLRSIISDIKSDPYSRRIIMSAWNPPQLVEMALPPCHLLCQFCVCSQGLTCILYQRSADMGLGVPFNIASYALLTRIIAQVCNIKAHEFIHVIGHGHVYINHIDALKEQISRTPRTFPLLAINPLKNDIDDFDSSDFELLGYNPHKKIHMDMAV
eukprot:GHVR01099386.1.p1 GENE.GHVR01099386.1~~GHVR01099386.1.p1  ORF type:complete len:252 (+),score=37.12 GHVR01099386.1:460-1215(+)